MDERELTRLFEGAADDAPRASFDVSDVTAASRRATARRRMRIATVTSITAVVLAGAGVIGVTSPFSGLGDDETVAGSALENSGSPGEQPNQPDMRLEDGDSRGSQPLSKQGGSADAAQADKLGIASTARCTEVDRELATALAGELPVAPDDAVPGRLCSDGGNAAYRVTDGAATGLLMAAQLPDRSHATIELGADATVATARTSSGGIVVVASVPTGGSATAPFADDVPRIADAIAASR